jgi:hypothetical protein
MIARTWRGRTSAAKANDYHRHFMSAVVPNLKRIAGHKGAYLLRREVDGDVEFLAVTLWDSLETIKAFTGLIRVSRISSRRVARRSPISMSSRATMRSSSMRSSVRSA